VITSILIDAVITNRFSLSEKTKHCVLLLIEITFENNGESLSAVVNDLAGEDV
jgi:hypothetical protein